VQLARLRVDKMGGKRAGVATEERVRERAIAPEEAGEMESHEQLSERTADDGFWGRQHPPAEDEAIRERELEHTRDDHRIEVASLDDEPDGVDSRHTTLAQIDEEPVLAFGDALRQLLQRVVRPVQVDEPNDVAADAARDLDNQVLGPFLEGQAPREAEERALVRAGDEAEVIASGGNGGGL
jgi:hypothetical protein